MKWALVGASDIAATRVIPAMRAVGHEVVGVFSSSVERGATYAAAHQIPTSTTSLAELLSGDCDAVYISTTNQLHAQQAIAAAAAGKHVLCEKPLAMSVHDARAIVAACEEAGVVLATNHHLRSSAVNRKARELVLSGELGSLRAVRMHHAVSLPERLRGWRIQDKAAGAGVLLDITVHDADTLRFVTGREVHAVSAVTSSQAFGGGDVEDTAYCVLMLDDGSAALTHESFAVPHAYTALEVHGTEASLYIRDALTQDPDGDVVLRRDGVERLVDPGPRDNLYEVTLRAFASAVDGVGVPMCSGADGIASLAVALAARLSSQEGRPVAVSEIVKGSEA